MAHGSCTTTRLTSSTTVSRENNRKRAQKNSRHIGKGLCALLLFFVVVSVVDDVSQVVVHEPLA